MPSSAAVTDEDRNRFGALLDKAAERGLLGAADYQVRLRELAEAATTEEMVAIVTDLPAFRAHSATASRTGSGSAGTTAGRSTGDGWPSGSEGQRRRGGASPWLILAVLVVLAVVSLVVLTLIVGHEHRTPSGASDVGAAVSALRL